MHTKDFCSSSSQSGCSDGLMPAGNMRTDGMAFALSGYEYGSCEIKRRQDLVNCLGMCLSGLAETSKEFEALQEKMEKLRARTTELQKNLNLQPQTSLDNRFGGGGGYSFQQQCIPFGVLNSFNGLNLDASSSTQSDADKEEEALELDVNNMEMLKSELCNKWQKTGKCRYGKNCQYAHSIGELSPLIRQPCRLVLAGRVCPFGHKCHFRHRLTQHEKAMLSSIKLER